MVEFKTLQNKSLFLCFFKDNIAYKDWIDCKLEMIELDFGNLVIVSFGGCNYNWWIIKDTNYIDD